MGEIPTVGETVTGRERDQRARGREHPSIGHVLDRAAVRAVYQPIVELESCATVAFEALARGPEGSWLEMPDRLFAVARAQGRLQDLDRLCRRAALAGAREAGIGRAQTLFVNVEPESLMAATPESALAPLDTVDDLRIVVEVTERALTSSPADLLAAVHTARACGFGIALDDVGANPESLALLPFIRPDVVKLDMALVRDRPDLELGRTMTAVGAYAERSGATILAEGIEDDAHLERAITLGATLGQGWRFGRPGALGRPLPDACIRPVQILPALERNVAPSPFQTATRAGRPMRIGRRDVLLQVSRYLEAKALADPDRPVVLAAFQDAGRITPATAARYAELARHCNLVAAFGAGLSSEPLPGVRGAALEADDVLRDEWSVVVVGPHDAGALLARDLGDGGADADRRFEFTVTHDRALVEEAAIGLLGRITRR